MLANLYLSGQTKFSFDEKTLKIFNESLFPVEYKKISDSSGSRNAYMVLTDQEIPISSDELKGQFIEISHTMGFHDQDISGHFRKNELSEKVMQYFEIKNNYISLIENEATKKLYVINYYVIKSILDEKEEKQKYEADRETVNQFMQSIGYKPYLIGENLYVKTKYYRIWCTMATLEVLQKDKEYLKKVDNWYEQREAIRKQIIATIPKFDHYVRLYKVQRNRMSKADISAWTVLTKSANSLNKKQVDLTDKLWGLIELQDTTNAYNKPADKFIDYLGVSKGILGI